MQMTVLDAIWYYKGGTVKATSYKSIFCNAFTNISTMLISGYTCLVLLSDSVFVVQKATKFIAEMHVAGSDSST